MGEDIEEKKAKARGELCAENARLRIKLTEARNIIHDAFHSDDKAFVVGNDTASWRHLSAGVAKLRELLRPMPDSAEWRTEAVYYGATLPGEYRTPQAAIDAVTANPPLPWGGCKQPIGGEEGKTTRKHNERGMKMEERNKMEEESKEVSAMREPGSHNGAEVAYGQRVVEAWNYLDGLDIRVTAKLMRVDGELGKNQWQVEVYCNGRMYFIGSVFGGKWTTIEIVKALRNAMTHRIMNRRRKRRAYVTPDASKEAKAAATQGQPKEDLHTPPARRGEEKAGLNLNGRIDT